MRLHDREFGCRPDRTLVPTELVQDGGEVGAFPAAGDGEMRLLVVRRQPVPGIDLSRETHPQHPGVDRPWEGAGAREPKPKGTRPSPPPLPPLQLTLTFVRPTVTKELERHMPARWRHPPQPRAGGAKAVYPLVEVLLHLWWQQERGEEPGRGSPPH